MDPSLTAQVSDFSLLSHSAINRNQPTESRIETQPAEAIDPTGIGLPMVTTETPELEQLAAWQSLYLGMLGDDGNALAGFYDPFSYQFAFGSEGAQAYRLGWYSYNDFALMPMAPTTIGAGFQDLEWNAWVRYAQLNSNSTVFSGTASMNGKFWSGPTGINLPPDAGQFIGDLQLASADAGPWNWQVGVTPQYNGTFENRMNSNGLMVDARAVLFFRPSPKWLFACGAAFWNRASDRLIPYGGIIWAPDDRWEIRMMFPKSRVSYYLGRLRGADTWIYAAGEYNLDAYEVDLQGSQVSTRGQTSDYRVLIGASATTGIWTMFLEGGIVTDRHFRFRGSAPDFAIGDSGFLRTGILF
jgi:hypothetical protein